MQGALNAIVVVLNVRQQEIRRVVDNRVNSLQELFPKFRHKHVNGQIERVHRTMGSYLKTYCDNTPTEWTDFIPSLRFALNTRIHSSTKMSPYFMTYMEHPTFPWSQNKHLSYSESDVISKVRLLNHARELILSNSDEAKAASKKAYDIKTKTQRFEPGEKDACF